MDTGRQGGEDVECEDPGSVPDLRLQALQLPESETRAPNPQ